MPGSPFEWSFQFASNDLMGRFSPATPQHLSQALKEMVRHPLRTIVPPWSWKAAACTATIRAFAFFAANLRSGREQATKALLVEAVFAVFAGGLIGAVSQYLRSTKPLWATAVFLSVVLPGAMTLAQATVHHIAGTQHQSSGLVASFLLAAFAAAYTWYAMRHGAMVPCWEALSKQPCAMICTSCLASAWTSSCVSHAS